MKHIKKAVSYSVAGTLGLTVMASLNGCSEQTPVNNLDSFNADQGTGQEGNFFMVIEQTGSNPDTYKLVEKHATSGPTRAILRAPDGTERFLSEEELKRIAEEEAARVEAGTSRLTQENAMTAGGMSLGETLLAAAAGSLIGGMLANSLMGNRNFQRHQSQYGGGKPTTQMARNSTSSKTTTKPKSGFFGGNTSGSSSRTSSFGSFGG